MSLQGRYVFNGPKWHWTRLNYQIEYGPVDNLVTIRGENVKERHAHVSVPAEFVKFLHDTVEVKSVVQLFLEQRSSRWAFGFTVDGESYDLWYYTATGFPSWARNK